MLSPRRRRRTRSNGQRRRSDPTSGAHRTWWYRDPRSASMQRSCSNWSTSSTADRSRPAARPTSCATQEIADEGIVAASGGNHGAAVAWVAQRFGHAAHIFVPTTASPDQDRPAARLRRRRSPRRRRIRRRTGRQPRVSRRPPRQLDPRLRRPDRDGRRRNVRSRTRPRRSGTRCRAGRLRRRRPVGQHRRVVSATAPRSWWSRPPVLRPMRRRSPPGRRSTSRFRGSPPMRSGRHGSAHTPGTRCSSVGATSVVVSDADVIAARRRLWKWLRIVVEPAAAAPIAALTSGAWRPPSGGRIGIVVCGANTPLDGSLSGSH